MTRSNSARLAFLAAVLVALTALAPAWAADARRPMTYEDMRRLRVMLPTLLQVQRVRNDETAHYLHNRDSLKAVTSADLGAFSKEPGKVGFRLGPHPKAYTTPIENSALFQLGVTAGLGHFAIVNANVPELKDYAQTILRSLVKVADSTYLSGMSGEFNGVLQAVSDPSFNGGPSKTLDKYDALVNKLADRTIEVYQRDGAWYFVSGVTLAGLHAIPGRDKFIAPYFRNMLERVYNRYPSSGLSFDARHTLAQILRTDFPHDVDRHNRIGHNVARGQDLAWKAIVLIHPAFGKS